MSAPTKKRATQNTMITFRVDEQLLKVLERLENAVGPGVGLRSRRSIAIRRALLEADRRNREGG
jgi:hypothetical protein